MPFTVTLSHASVTTITVNFTTADNTAVAPGDYAAISGTLTFAPGQTMLVLMVPIRGDTTQEADETLSVVLSNPSGAILALSSATGAILNDGGADGRTFLSLIQR